MSAEDGFNKGEMWPGSVLGTGSSVPSTGRAKFKFSAGFQARGSTTPEMEEKVGKQKQNKNS